MGTSKKLEADSNKEGAEIDLTTETREVSNRIRYFYQHFMAKNSSDAIADFDLLTGLLIMANSPRDVARTAHRLLSRFGSFAKILAAPNPELMRVDGMDKNRLITLKLVHTCAKRLARSDLIEEPVLNNYKKLYDYLIVSIGHESIEQFHVLYLDAKNHLLEDETISYGTINFTAVYPREIIKRALELRSTAIILVHNHPSGSPAPSNEDYAITTSIENACNPMSIKVHDHIIVGNGECVSLAHERLM